MSFNKRKLVACMVSIVLAYGAVINTHQIDIRAYAVDYHGIDIAAKTDWYSSSQDEQARTIMQGLMNRGFTKTAAAGAVGNFWLESGLDPSNNVDNASADACGLPMWTDGVDCNNKTRFLDYCSSHSLDPHELDVQLDYLCIYSDDEFVYRDLSGYGVVGLWDSLPVEFSECNKVSLFGAVEWNSPEQAAEVWLWWHEGPSVYYSHALARMEAAKKAYQLADGLVGDSSSSSSSSGGVTSGGGTIDNSGGWVDHKDDWRHGIVAGDSRVQYFPGMARGDYATNIAGGQWYWYHQTMVRDDCIKCGTWTHMLWGKDGGVDPLGKNGCSIYSLSILVSNLINEEITPSVLLTDFDCEIQDDNKKCNTNDSEFINDTQVASLAAIEGRMKYKYDLLCTLNFATKSDSEISQMIDDTLDKHGIVWYRYKAEEAADTGWPYAETQSHYVCIVGKESGGYIILDSCNTEEQMSKPVPLSDILSHKYDGTDGDGGVIQGWWNPKKIWINGHVFDGGNWYVDASEIGKYKNKIEVGTAGGQTFYLYDGLPWAYESGAYAVNLNQAAIDLETYVKSVSVTKEFHSTWGYESMEALVNDESSWISARMSNQPGYPSSGVQGEWTWSGDSIYKVIDGVACVGCGLPPIAIDPNYNDYFGNYVSDEKNYWLSKSTPDASMYGYGTRKMAAILKDISGGKDDGKVFYLPISSCDAKAHTFPGGIGQTTLVLGKNPIKLNSSGKPSEIVKAWAAENGNDFATPLTGKWEKLMDIMNHEYNYGGKVACWDRMWNIGEFVRVPSSVANTVINSGNYKMIGVVAYPS